MRKSKHGAYTQSLNAQASVDAEGSFLVVGNHLTQKSGDWDELVAAHEAISEELGKPSALIADAGYSNAEAFGECRRCRASGNWSASLTTANACIQSYRKAE